MSSLLVIEDGTGVDGANSYATAVEARSYASVRGVALPAAPGSGNDPVEQWLILANDYLESLDYIGRQADPVQALQWPRLFCYGDALYNSDDPTTPVLAPKVKTAQMQLVVEQFNGIDLLPSTSGGTEGQVVTRERVDVIETEYSDKFGAPILPTMPKVEVLLKGLIQYAFLRVDRA